MKGFISSFKAGWKEAQAKSNKATVLGVISAADIDVELQVVTATPVEPPAPVRDNNGDIEITIPRTTGPLGLDLETRIKRGKVVVTRVHPGYAAAEAGTIFAGDVVVAVDGTPVVGKKRNDVYRMIRGIQGDTINLTVSRSTTAPPPTRPAVGQQVDATATTAPHVVRGRSARMLQRAGSAASLPARPISLIRQHSHRAREAERVEDVLTNGCAVLVGLVLLVGGSAPHVAALMISLNVGGGVCAQPLQMWLLLVGFFGLVWHIVIVVGGLRSCSQDSSPSSSSDSNARKSSLEDKYPLLSISYLLLFSAWILCIVFLVYATRSDCFAFDVADFNRIDVNRTLSDEPLLPDATLATLRANALERCDPAIVAAPGDYWPRDWSSCGRYCFKPLVGPNQPLSQDVYQTSFGTNPVLDVPCAYVLLACDPDLWHATKGMGDFCVVLFFCILGLGCVCNCIQRCRECMEPDSSWA